MSQLDVTNAKKALTARLVTWGCPATVAPKHAAGFIDDLVAQGWQMALNRESRPFPPKAGQDCPHHPGQWADRCGGCLADQRAADGTDTPPRSWEPAEGNAAALARAAMAQAKARLCPCGVPRLNCTEHATTPTSAESAPTKESAE